MHFVTKLAICIYKCDKTLKMIGTCNMQFGQKIFILIAFSLFFSSNSFANTNWKQGEYTCKDPNAKITIIPDYHEQINFSLKNNIKILDGTLGVFNGIDKSIRTQNKKASFSVDKRKFGFILKKKNTSNHPNSLILL